MSGRLISVLMAGALVAGCSETERGESDDGGYADGGVDAAGESDAANAIDDAGDGSDPPVVEDNSESPGELVKNPKTAGSGPCSGRTLEELISIIHERNPELADIRDIYHADPNIGGDGSYIYPYQKDDGGFAIVLKRGQGDCPSGCTDNEYWYFETDEECRPEQVGHYYPSYGEGDCIEQDGLPMWGRPPTPDPVWVCGEDQSPDDISGSYRFTAVGVHVPCIVGVKSPGRDVRLEVSIVLAQDTVAPERGTATIEGTGHSLVDGRPLVAKFVRRRFEVIEDEDNLPSLCPSSHELGVHYDFEGFGQRTIELLESDTPDCEGAPDDYCKGYLHLDLELIE